LIIKKFSCYERRFYSTSEDELKIITKKELEDKIKGSPNDFYLIDVRGTDLIFFFCTLNFTTVWNNIDKSNLKNPTKQHKEQSLQQN